MAAGTANAGRPTIEDDGASPVLQAGPGGAAEIDGPSTTIDAKAMKACSAYVCIGEPTSRHCLVPLGAPPKKNHWHGN